MNKFTIDELLNVAQKKGYKVFDNDSKNFNINIWGIRAVPGVVNAFDDLIVVFWKYNGLWNVRYFNATTEPGRYWLNNPINTNGTAILKEGQYKGIWKIGLHQNKYTALVQVGNATVIRDNDKDSELDYNVSVETGLFGINCHRAGANGQSITVDKWSAGCQVMQNEQIQISESNTPMYAFDYFMLLCEQAAEIHGNSFTYTLITERDI